MAVLDLLGRNLGPVSDPVLLQPGSSEVPHKLHRLVHLHSGHKLYPGWNLHVSVAGGCTDSCRHDSNGVRSTYCLRVLRKYTMYDIDVVDTI